MKDNAACIIIYYIVLNMKNQQDTENRERNSITIISAALLSRLMEFPAPKCRVGGGLHGSKPEFS